MTQGSCVTEESTPGMGGVLFLQTAGQVRESQPSQQYLLLI